MKEQQSANIEKPHDHDVLSRADYSVNYHSGNGYFCRLVKKHKAEYFKASKSEKKRFSRLIVDHIRNRNPPGRFLKMDQTTKKWYDIGDKKALNKTRQALRERAYEFDKSSIQNTPLHKNASENSLGETSGLIPSVSRTI